MLRSLPAWIKITLVSSLVTLALIYFFGTLFVGPYQGNLGILGFFFRIYTDAFQAKPAPWILLMSVPTITIIWHKALNKKSQPDEA